MKVIIGFVTVLALAYGDYKISEDFKTKMLTNVLETFVKCTKAENVSEAELKEIENEKTPKSKAGKCLISCVYQEVGLQGKDGKFTKEAIEKSLVVYKSEDINLYNDLYKLITETCLAQVKSTDRCEAAAEITDCYQKNASLEMRKADNVFA